MAKQLVRALLALAAVAVATTGAAAQTSANSSVSVTVPTVLYINASANFSFGAPDVKAYDAGEIASSNTITLVHKGNVAHDVQIQASADLMTYTGSQTAPSKPVTDLGVSLDGGSTYTPVARASTTTLSATEGLLVNGAARGQYTKTASARIGLAYDKDPPGTYGASFTFTIVAD